MNSFAASKLIKSEELRSGDILISIGDNVLLGDERVNETSAFDLSDFIDLYQMIEYAPASSFCYRHASLFIEEKKEIDRETSPHRIISHMTAAGLTSFEFKKNFSRPTLVVRNNNSKIASKAATLASQRPQTSYSLASGGLFESALRKPDDSKESKFRERASCIGHVIECYTKAEYQTQKSSTMRLSPATSIKLAVSYFRANPQQYDIFLILPNKHSDRNIYFLLKKFINDEITQLHHEAKSSYFFSTSALNKAKLISTKLADFDVKITEKYSNQLTQCQALLISIEPYLKQARIFGASDSYDRIINKMSSIGITRDFLVPYAGEVLDVTTSDYQQRLSDHEHEFLIRASR